MFRSAIKFCCIVSQLCVGFTVSSQETNKTSFVPGDSIGWFVGVNDFNRNANVGKLNYSVDDCIDMAYLFSFELGLIYPENVYLSISGQPKKKVTLDRLKSLQIHNAKVSDPNERDDPYFPTQKNLVRLSKELPGKSGSNGYLIYYFSTHGFEVTANKQPHLFAYDSVYDPENHDAFVETTVPFTEIQEGIDNRVRSKSQSGSQKVLLFVDACREWVHTNKKTEKGIVVEPIPAWQSDEAFQSAFEDVGDSQAVFFAADRGTFAHEFSDLNNGVMSYFIQYGLRFGKVRPGDDNILTIGDLMSWVDEQTRQLTVQRDVAPQSLRMEGAEIARNIPLPVVESFFQNGASMESADENINNSLVSAYQENMISIEKMRLMLQQFRNVISASINSSDNISDADLSLAQRANEIRTTEDLIEYCRELELRFPDYFENYFSKNDDQAFFWNRTLDKFLHFNSRTLLVISSFGCLSFIGLLGLVRFVSRSKELQTMLAVAKEEERKNGFKAYNMYVDILKKFSSAEAQKRLGVLCKNGYGAKNKTNRVNEAILWFEKSANSGDAEAMYLLGEFLINEHRHNQSSKQYKNGVKWIKKASKKGLDEAKILYKKIAT